MEIFIRDNKYNGYIEKDKNTYYIVVENDDENKLQRVENNIKTYDADFKEITCLYNFCEKYFSFKNIKKYKAESIITGHIDETVLKIKEIIIQFKELDQFFIKDRMKIDLPTKKQMKIQCKLKSILLYKNDKFKMFYERSAGIENNKFGEKILKNSSKIRISLNEEIKYNDDFQYYVRCVENIFGFLLGRKMTLLNIDIVDSQNKIYSIITRNMKSYQDTIWEDLHVVDLSSLSILKNIINKYFENKTIASCINNYYEYIYNDLDETFEFISLVNTLELIATTRKYNTKTIQYAKSNNEVLKEENIIMRKIQRKMKMDNKFQKKEIGMVSKYYRFDNVTLADKIKYFLYKKFELTQNESSDKIIFKIVKTRNYFVHGGSSKNLLSKIELVQIKNLLKNVLYILIMESCCKKENINIKVSRKLIPIIYNALISD